MRTGQDMFENVLKTLRLLVPVHIREIIPVWILLEGTIYV